MIQEIYSKFIECEQQVSTDTRKIPSGCIFFALKGPHFNGNKFAKEALVKGAKFAVIDQKEFFIEGKTFLVEDALVTLQNLAQHHRSYFKIPVIGITGTNGKTTTKELIGKVLSSKYKILITEGNLNNHIGVPMTLLKINSKHELAIIEMGASKIGDIKELAEISMPTHAIITNIGKAHLEGFGSLENIKKTKLELYDYVVNNNGEIIINMEDQVLTKEVPNSIKTYGYGLQSGEINGEIISYNPTIDILLKFGDKKEINISTSLLGGYNLKNILAAACIGKVFDISETLIAKSIESYHPTNNRSQLIQTSKNIIIADCYNANPSSTFESIASLKAMNKKKQNSYFGRYARTWRA
jgi:UDP-N-acetylmuramoyl-tripeptide--D-alanyl-D-alanine ligase